MPLQPHGNRRPLFIVHGVGGNVVNFYGLAMRMGTETSPSTAFSRRRWSLNQPALLHLKDMAAHYIKPTFAKCSRMDRMTCLATASAEPWCLRWRTSFALPASKSRMLGMIDSKSRDYDEELTRLKPKAERVSNRMNQFSRNTGNLSPMARIKYIADKINTRAIRFACMAAARLHMKQVPAFMRSAYDINYVAVHNYKPRPYDGRLILFRASEQDFRGPYDLGWGGLFSKGVEIHDLTGDHERIFLEPNIDLLARSLRETLAIAK